MDLYGPENFQTKFHIIRVVLSTSTIEKESHIIDPTD